jgi:hypothetical protein
MEIFIEMGVTKINRLYECCNSNTHYKKLHKDQYNHKMYECCKKQIE